jgi:hypothetical protein
MVATYLFEQMRSCQEKKPETTAAGADAHRNTTRTHHSAHKHYYYYYKKKTTTKKQRNKIQNKATHLGRRRAEVATAVTNDSTADSRIPDRTDCHSVSTGEDPPITSLC